jgi:hypothetical protein
MTRVKTKKAAVIDESMKIPGFQRFSHTMLSAWQKHVRPPEEEMQDLKEAAHNYLFNEGPRGVRRKPLTPRELFTSKLFWGFTEIYDSLEMLDDIFFLIGRFPYSNTRISKERHLQIVVEAHYQEIYILQERLKQYLTVVERQYKTDPRHLEINKRCKNLGSMVLVLFKGVLQVRNSHVHQMRFSDEGLDRLKTLGLLANHSEHSSAYKIYYRSQYAKTREEWREKIKINNDEIHKTIDVISNFLHTIIFDEANLDFIFPPRI